MGDRKVKTLVLKIICKRLYLKIFFIDCSHFSPIINEPAYFFQLKLAKDLTNLRKYHNYQICMELKY